MQISYKIGIKGIISTLFISIVFTCFLLPPIKADTILNNGDISAQSAILIDARSGIVFFEKNADAQLSMASTTKIMTTILAIESGRLDEQFKVTASMIKVEGSSMGLCEGDIVTLRTLCYGMMLSSGNDAANAAAMFIGGNVTDFAALMNKKAAEVGMTNSNFVTPSGLDAKDHYSTARDMAALAKYAMQNETFAEIVSLERTSITFGDPVQKRTLTNHNKLLRMYDGTCGIKTGFTKKSGRCLVSSAQKDGGMLIAVTLNAPDDWDDHIKMFDYGFSQMESCTLDGNMDGTTIPVTGGTANELNLVAEEIKTLVPIGYKDKITRVVLICQFAYAPIKEGDEQGEIIYYINNNEIAKAKVYAADNVKSIHLSDKSWFERLVRNILLLLSG